jgi:hypothetical protein
MKNIGGPIENIGGPQFSGNSPFDGQDPDGWQRDEAYEGAPGGSKKISNPNRWGKAGTLGAAANYQIQYKLYHARKEAFKARPQPKAPPARAARKLDDSLLTGKKPSSDIDKRQQLATAGETIPIVFGKRVDDIGGIWVQPSMVKSGTKLFVGSFLYAISQGKIVSSPVKYRTWVGPQSLAFIADQAITLQHDYASAAEIAAAPDTCPIGGGTLFCGVETYSYLSQLAKAEVGAVYTYSYDPYSYYTTRLITRGLGNTSNTVATLTGNDVFAFNSDDGTDISAAYLAYKGWTISTLLSINFNPATGGGFTVGSIDEAGTIAPQSPGFLGIPAGARLVIQFTIAAVNNQYNPSLPASTGTLYGVQQENIESPYNYLTGTYSQSGTTVIVTAAGHGKSVGSTVYVEITSGNGVEGTYIVATVPNANTFTYTAGTSLTTSGNLYLPLTPGADNSAYTDITFLRVEGNIYEPPSEGSYPTTTKQLFIYYEQGVEVDLYSGGLVGGVYPRGASNQFVDMAMYLFSIYKRADGADTADIASPIYTGNLTSIAAFCDYYGFFFNGVLEDSVNIIDLISQLAPYFILSFLSIGGQYCFEPLLPLDGIALDEGALTPVATFTEDEILPGSFNKSFYPVTDRQDFIAVMVYREANPSEIGIQRTLQVSYETTALDAPVEQFDMTDFCTYDNHVISYAVYELAKRRLSTHSISFETALIVTGLKPTDIIKIDRQRITSAGDDRSEVEWYQINSITFDAEGRSTIQAEHFPVTASDVSAITYSMINDAFRVI